jgi:hypothetical protein
MAEEHGRDRESEAQKTVIQRQIDHADAEIDRLVYSLYGLTANNSASRENAASKADTPLTQGVAPGCYVAALQAGRQR